MSNNSYSKYCFADILGLYDVENMFRAVISTLSDAPERLKISFCNEIGLLFEDWKTHGFSLISGMFSKFAMLLKSSPGSTIYHMFHFYNKRILVSYVIVPT